jgi:hypothetical protein
MKSLSPAGKLKDIHETSMLRLKSICLPIGSLYVAVRVFIIPLKPVSRSSFGQFRSV